MRRFFIREELRSVLGLAAPIAVLQTGLILQGTVATLFASFMLMAWKGQPLGSAQTPQPMHASSAMRIE